MADKKINNLLRFNKNQKWLVFDFETEGLNLFRDRPWQIAWNLYKGDKLIQSEDFYLWWEDLRISEGAAKATRFNYDDYKSKAVPPEGPLKLFSNVIYDKSVLISGANIIGYDTYIFGNVCPLVGLPKNYSWVERLFDVQNIEKAIELNYTIPQEENMLSWNYKLYNYRKKGLKTSVEALCKKYDILYDKNKAHDAATDIEYTYQILRKQLFQINI